jgi:hypothetical protein
LQLLRLSSTADFASKHGVLDLTIDDEVYPARIGMCALVGVCLNMLIGLSHPLSSQFPIRVNMQTHPDTVNLPCVVEVHKTVDQVTLFKSGDVGQMVIVYGALGVDGFD